jgi:hypothetical protein
MDHREEVPTGYFEVASIDCTDSNLESCEKISRDCIRVRKSDAGRLKIEIFSVQANMHICSVEFDAVAVDGELIEVGSGDSDGSEGYGGIRVKVERDRFTVRDNRSSPIKRGCGAHSGLDGLSFPFISRTFDRQCAEE